jgi:hypothetical protein
MVWARGQSYSGHRNTAPAADEKESHFCLFYEGFSFFPLAVPYYLLVFISLRVPWAMGRLSQDQTDPVNSLLNCATMIHVSSLRTAIFLTVSPDLSGIPFVNFVR